MTDEALIRKSTVDRAKAIHDRDAEGLLRHYAPEVRIFDLAPPLQYQGVIASRRKGIEAWFQTWSGPIGFETRDLEIQVAGDIAFAHGLVRISGTKTDGATPDVWLRSTVGYRRIDGRWLVTHEHESVPFDMTTFMASLDLKP